MDKLGRVGHWCIWTGEGQRLISMLEVTDIFAVLASTVILSKLLLKLSYKTFFNSSEEQDDP